MPTMRTSQAWIYTLGIHHNARLRGLVRLIFAVLLVPAGILLVMTADHLGGKVRLAAVVPLLAGISQLPWSAYELLIGGDWGEGRPLVRLAFIAVVLPLVILPPIYFLALP